MMHGHIYVCTKKLLEKLQSNMMNDEEKDIFIRPNTMALNGTGVDLSFKAKWLFFHKKCGLSSRCDCCKEKSTYVDVRKGATVAVEEEMKENIANTEEEKQDTTVALLRRKEFIQKNGVI